VTPWSRISFQEEGSVTKLWPAARHAAVLPSLLWKERSGNRPGRELQPWGGFAINIILASIPQLPHYTWETLSIDSNIFFLFALGIPIE
jgi:hypothetical protein